MICDKASITHWLNNEMEEGERKAFEVHLSECSTCKEEANAAEKLMHQLEQINISEPSANLELRFEAILNNYKKSVQKKESKWKLFWSDLYEKLTIKPSLQLAYSLLLLLIGISVAYLFLNTGSKNNNTEQIAKLSSR